MEAAALFGGTREFAAAGIGSPLRLARVIARHAIALLWSGVTVDNPTPMQYAPAYSHANPIRAITMHPTTSISILFFIAAMCILVVAYFAVRRRKMRGGWPLTWLCLASAWWATTEGMLYLGLGIRTNMVITYIQYLGVTPLPPLTLLFSLSAFGLDSWMTQTKLRLLLLLAIVVVALVWTNPLHRLVFSSYFSVGNGTMLGLEHGVLWWIIIGYHYLLLLVTSAVLVHQVAVSSGLQRSQAIVMVVSIGIVWIVNAIYVSGNSPVPNIDFGPLAFIITALAFSWGFFRCNLLDILPIAKAEIFLGLNEPILVLDDKNRVLDLNPAAELMFSITTADSIGRDIAHLLADHPQLSGLPKESATLQVDLTLKDRRHVFELRISILKDKRGAPIGRVVIFQDITERKRAADAQREQERLQGVLEMAGAVCHELNQPLMAILGITELISLNLPADDPLTLKLTALSEQVQRLSTTTQRLMRITRYETKTYLDKKIIDIVKSSQSTDVKS